jgi:hypothetical protein
LAERARFTRTPFDHAQFIVSQFRLNVILTAKGYTTAQVGL